MATGTTYPLSATKILKGLEELRDQKVLCDVHLVADNESFPAHRVVLTAASPYFKTMFTGGFKENELDTINFKDTNAEGLKCVLDAIYKAEVKVTEDNVENIMSVAHLFQNAEIITACETFLSKNNTVKNCLKFLFIAEKYELQDVIDESNKLMIDNFEEVAKTEEIMKISKEALCKHLSDDNLKICNGEIEVFRLAVKWIEYNLHKEERRADDLSSNEIVEIMNLVRLPFIPAELLIDEVLQVPFIDENKECRKVVTEALRFHSNVYAQPLQEGPQYKPRGKNKLTIILAGERGEGFSVENDETEIHYLNIKGDEPFTRSESSRNLPFSFARLGMSVVAKNNYLFLFGTLNKLFYPVAKRYDVTSNKWIDLRSPPYQATLGSAVAILCDDIYLTGGGVINIERNGVDLDNLNPEAWKYSILKNEWTKENDMPKALWAHAVVAHRDVVYVAGGVSSSGDCSSALYAYDVLCKLWLRKADMHEKRYNFCLENIDGALYACGGRDSYRPVKNIEVYSIQDDQWTFLQSAEIHHCYLSATAVLHNKLYFLGGNQKNEAGDGVDVDTISCLDPKSHRLTEVGKLPFHAYRHKCAFVTVPRS